MKTTVNNIDFNPILLDAIEKSKMEYLSDVSWRFENTTHKNCVEIGFYQDEDGNNQIEQFCIKLNNKWVDVEPTEAQLKLMFDKLNSITYRENEDKYDYNSNYNNYENNGVQPSNFY
jgi:hypothetical protein